MLASHTISVAIPNWGCNAIRTWSFNVDDQTTNSKKQSVRVRETRGVQRQNGHLEESSRRLWANNRASPKSNLKEPNSLHWAVIINPTELTEESMKFKPKQKNENLLRQTVELTSKPTN